MPVLVRQPSATGTKLDVSFDDLLPALNATFNSSEAESLNKVCRRAGTAVNFPERAPIPPCACPRNEPTFPRRRRAG